MYLYGYRNDEVDMPLIGEVKSSIIERLHNVHDSYVRHPVSVSIGCHTVGAIPPHSDMHHYPTIKGGIQKRFLMKPPQHDQKVRCRMRDFIARWIKKNLTPLSSDTDTSVETWLENTNYPRSRKIDLIKQWAEAGGCCIKGKHTSVRSFVKDEFYPEFKHPRLINSRHDVYKMAVGPIFKLIEKEVFALPWFIKKIPVSERASYIMDRLYRPNGVYIATDYTAYETHFTKEMMEFCEMQLYKHMTQKLPDRERFIKLMGHITGKNALFGNTFKVEVNATRMSGEMNTSLGNGFSNLMFMLFACEEAGARNVTGVVEGDDGLFCVDGNAPNVESFIRLGLTIKLTVCDNISSASFCGLIFDEEDKVNISNPYKVLSSFAWVDKKYCFAGVKKLKQLLLLKSLSLLYQYGNAPVFQALARYGVRVARDGLGGTRGISASSITDSYKRDFAEQAYLYYGRHSEMLFTPVPIRTRMLMEREFGLTIESQLKIEQYLDNLESLQPLDLPMVTYVAHDSWTIMWEKYRFECQPLVYHHKNGRESMLDDKFIRTV